MNAGIPITLMLATTSHTDPNEAADELRMITHGVLTREFGRDLLVYEERQKDADTGEEISQQVTLEIIGSRITMHRIGAFGMTMVFECGQRYESTYHTPWGDMDMSIQTELTEAAIGSDKGRVRLRYQLDLQGGMAALNEIRIDYRASVVQR